MDETPTHIHGYRVVKAQRTARGGHVILVDRDNEPHRWVTGWLPRDQTSEWLFGHYLHDRADAEHDFTDRCKRGF